MQDTSPRKGESGSVILLEPGIRVREEIRRNRDCILSRSVDCGFQFELWCGLRKRWCACARCGSVFVLVADESLGMEFEGFTHELRDTTEQLAYKHRGNNG